MSDKIVMRLPIRKKLLQTEIHYQVVQDHLVVNSKDRHKDNQDVTSFHTSFLVLFPETNVVFFSILKGTIEVLPLCIFETIQRALKLGFM